MNSIAIPQPLVFEYQLSAPTWPKVADLVEDKVEDKSYAEGGLIEPRKAFLWLPRHLANQMHGNPARTQHLCNWLRARQCLLLVLTPRPVLRDWAGARLPVAGQQPQTLTNPTARLQLHCQPIF